MNVHYTYAIRPVQGDSERSQGNCKVMFLNRQGRQERQEKQKTTIFLGIFAWRSWRPWR